jgi:DNA-binding MarR family transcriptional regulator
MTTMRPSSRPPDLIEEVLGQLIRSLGLHRPLVLPGGEALSLSELTLLWVLAGAESGPMTQADLGRTLWLEKSTVSRLVAGLERRGWLARRRDVGNRRFVRVELTARGHELAGQLSSFMNERHRRVLAELTPAEQEALRVGIAALSRAVQAANNPSSRPA